MPLNWGRHKHQTSHRVQDVSSSIHDERVPRFFQSPTSAAYQHHDPNPYAIVSPASLTPDFDQSPSSCYRRELESPPEFSKPLSKSILNDPAFSSDPRVHPHFPLISPTFYKELPSKSPLVNNPSQTSQTAPSDISPHQEVLYSIKDLDCVSHPPSSGEANMSSTSVSLDSDSHTTLSAPAVPSATSHSHSLNDPTIPHVVSPVQLLFPFSTSPTSSSPSQDPGSSPAMRPPTLNRRTPARIVTAPEQRKKMAKPTPTRSDSAPVHADGSNRPTGKRRMKNFIRRFTISRVLDRIDEMDETDHFGAELRRDNSYDAIGSNLAQLGPAHMYNDIDVLRGDFYTKSKRENAPRQVRTQKLPRLPPIGPGLSRPSPNFVPGQIIPSGVISPPLHATQADAVISNPDLRNPTSGQLEPNDPRNHSPLYHLPPEMLPSRSSSHAPTSKSASQIHRFGKDIPHIPQRPAHDELVPYHLHQIHSAPGLPPAHNERYLETRSQARGDANQATSLSSPPVVESPDMANPHPRHRRTHSLDSLLTRPTTSTQSISRTQNSLQPPRNHHLPKRLVMPALLQPPQPLPQQQPLDIHPRTDPYDLHLESDPFPPTKGHTPEPAAMYHQGRKLLRKKAAVYPGNIPLPTHVPGAHAHSNPPLTKHLSLSATDTGNVKEVANRRRLSKRKHDI
ncbi:uncharacterized protein EDB93DRAFT_1111293 [Suillus bovinus]|uniref:uncharacterized protein n=1 Tax=Suillus bovinus TaxID=48563 RepID=UPI001B88562B|nr:uncharacterized protein EDB93DRAFT_1111293 [Suillus bovinus]KAG2159652.1 hypothetical protein EDB93DRAFT_1111293 [Suillus bovinus]